MLKFVIDKWEKNNYKLKNFYKNNKQEVYANSYTDIVKNTINIILNDEDYTDDYFYNNIEKQGYSFNVD